MQRPHWYGPVEKLVTSDLSELGLLLFVSVIVAIVTRRLRMPYTVGLVLAGIGLSFFPRHLDLQLSRELVFSVFLPPLVFEAALYISWQDLRKDLPIIGLLATVGVLLAAAVTAIGMHYAVGWSWASASVFGILISATDPVSVIATFKEAGMRGRLRLLVEAESLLNDGTAAVGFVVVLGLAAGSDGGSLNTMANFLLTFGGGVLCGALVGLALILFASRTDDHVVEMTLTALAAYGSFLFAEHFHWSGVLASLTAGLMTGSYRGSHSPWVAGREWLEFFWEYLVFVVNSLIFLLIGARVAQQHFGAAWLGVLVAIVLVMMGRAVAIYPLCALFGRGELKVPVRHQHVLFWGGLRGALALALALGLPEHLPQRDDIVTVSFAVVAFSIFAQGLTMRPLLRRVGELNGKRPTSAKTSA
jgi:CPA1 family monovalent cation:H+ antiporter